MTLQKAVDIFAVLFDKYGSPNLSLPETIDLMNMAQNEYINRLFPDSQGGVVNFDMDINTIQNIKSLIYELSISMASNGIVYNEGLGPLLIAASGDSTSTVSKILAIGWRKTGQTTLPVKYTKWNNHWASNRNVFKRASPTNPLFTIEARGFQFYPIDQSATLIFNVLKSPARWVASEINNSFEFNDYVCYNIIAIALKLAGVSVRDQEVLEDVRLSGIQITQ